jgi:hypothetical protein
MQVNCVKLVIKDIGDNTVIWVLIGVFGVDYINYIIYRYLCHYKDKLVVMENLSDNRGIWLVLVYTDDFSCDLV